MSHTVRQYKHVHTHVHTHVCAVYIQSNLCLVRGGAGMARRACVHVGGFVSRLRSSHGQRLEQPGDSWTGRGPGKGLLSFLPPPPLSLSFSAISCLDDIYYIAAEIMINLLLNR